MADVLISALSAASAVADTDLFEIEQGESPTNTSGKRTFAELKAALLLALAAPIQAATITTKVASATLALTDGTFIEMSVATANDLTVPLNSVVAFPIGTVKNINQKGIGQTTIVATGGVTINTPATLKLRALYSTAALVKIGTDEWTLMGDLEAAA